MRRHGSDAPVWFFNGLLLFGAAVGARRAAVPVEIGPRIADAAGLSGPSSSLAGADPDSLSARELRALPGIGPARALAIVQARWHGLRGGPAAWTSLSGIGDATAAAAAGALSGAAMEPPSERAYTRRESP